MLLLDTNEEFKFCGKVHAKDKTTKDKTTAEFYKNSTYKLTVHKQKYCLPIEISRINKLAKLPSEKEEILKLMNMFLFKIIKNDFAEATNYQNNLPLFFTINADKSTENFLYIECFMQNQNGSKNFFSFDISGGFQKDYFALSKENNIVLFKREEYASYEKTRVYTFSLPLDCILSGFHFCYIHAQRYFFIYWKQRNYVDNMYYIEVYCIQDFVRDDKEKAVHEYRIALEDKGDDKNLPWIINKIFQSVRKNELKRFKEKNKIEIKELIKAPKDVLNMPTVCIESIPKSDLYADNIDKWFQQAFNSNQKNTLLVQSKNTSSTQNNNAPEKTNSKKNYHAWFSNPKTYYSIGACLLMFIFIIHSRYPLMNMIY